MKNNPFSLDFGAEPNLFIPRKAEHNTIVETFNSETPSTHIFLIIGARCTGKTVLMTSVSHELREQPEWIHIDLNAEGNILNSLASNLYKLTKSKFPKVKFSFSVKGVGVSLEKEEKYYDVQADIDEMLGILAKKNIRVLITLDEAANSKDIREFTTYFQHSIREKLPVFVIMTGLYKNIRALQNNRSQTFLKRAPRIILGPLSYSRISRQYEKVFDIAPGDSDLLTRHTNGYSYGFQILGYLLYEAGKKFVDDELLKEYKINLEESSYDKIWEELSEGEKSVAIACAKAGENATVKETREIASMDSNKFSTYQDTLEKSGILSSTSSFGRVRFSLPYFDEFVLRQDVL